MDPVSDFSAELDALRPPVDDPPQKAKRLKRSSTAGPEAQPPAGDHLTARAPARPLGETLIAAMVGGVLLVTLALALGFDPGGDAQTMEAATGPAAGAAQPAATSTSSPPTTQATPPETAPPAVAGATTTPSTTPAPVATSTTTPTTRAAVAPTTTTTARPAPIAPVSATSAHPPVTLTVDLTPGEGVRALEGSLSALVADDEVLRAVRIDFGDGTVLPVAVHAWSCYHTQAPNPSVITLPDHVYGAGGTFDVTLVVTTGHCTWPDTDSGPETTSELRVTVVVS